MILYYILLAIWLVTMFGLGLAIYHNIKPYYKIRRAYKYPYLYCSTKHNSYRGLYNALGEEKMLKNYLIKNSWGIK